MGIIIEDIRYLDKFRPGETDVDWTLYNVGEPFDLEIDYRVEEVVVNDAENYEDGVNTFVVRPRLDESGIADNTNLIWSNNSVAFQNFNVGDDIEINGAKRNTVNGTHTIIEKIGENAIRVNNTIYSSFFKKGGTIHVVTPFKGHKYLFNFIENKEAANYLEATTGQENKLYYDNASTAIGATSMLWSGNETNRTGGATIEGNGTSTYGQRFTVKHSGVVTPLFLAAQIDDIQARLSPDYYEAGNCLRHVFKLEVNRDLSNPNDTQEVVYDERLGNTGWFNENYNGQNSNYTYSNLQFTRVSDAANINALELSAQVDATFRVSNFVNNPFSNTLTKGMALFWILPDNEENYQNNERTLLENFVHDYGMNTVGTVTNGVNFGTSLQAIEEIEITYVSSSEIDVRIRFSFGTFAKNIVNSNDFKRYNFSFAIENHSLNRKTSDKTQLLIHVDEFFLELFQSDLITNSTKFLEHRFSDFVDGVSNPEVFPVDDLVAYNSFSVDFNGLENDGIKILSIRNELVLKHATNAEIKLESNSYSTDTQSKLNGYVPIIDVEQNRAFTIEDNDFRRLVQVKRDEANDSGTVYAYYSTYPFFIRWEWWEALLGINDVPSGVFDSSLPNNGINHFWYRYQTLGYELNYRVKFVMDQNGVQFEQSFDSPLTMHDFNSNADWGNESIKAFDKDTATELISGSNKFLQGYKDTKLVAEFERVSGVQSPIEDIDIVFWIITKEKGTINSVRRASSVYSASGDTWFKGITTPNLVDKSKLGAIYKGEILADGSKLSGTEFTVYSRLYDQQITPPPPPPFIITVDTTLAGSPSDTFILPLESSSTYNFTVDWGDGNQDIITSWNQAELTHVYSSSGIYDVTVSGDFPRIFFNGSGDRLKLIDIKQWGDISWGNFTRAFSGCSNLVCSFIDAPDLSAVFETSYMFNGCSLFNQDISSWNVSVVTNMQFMFSGCSLFNQDISSWNVNGVTNMQYMFFSCSSFNQNIGSWNVGSVTTMLNMFNGCSLFNQDISSWNVSNVTRMDGMFVHCSSFNQNIGSWNVGSVTNMNGMLQNCSSFNQNIGSWNVGSVTTMTNMFNGCSLFNQDISSWNVSVVTNMQSMFSNCLSFNQDIGLWNVGSVTNMTNMFQGITLSTSNYNALLTGWTGWIGGLPTKTVQNNVTFSGGNSTYSLGTDAESARNYLTGTKLWTITDGGGV